MVIITSMISISDSDTEMEITSVYGGQSHLNKDVPPEYVFVAGNISPMAKSSSSNLVFRKRKRAVGTAKQGCPPNKKKKRINKNAIDHDLLPQKIFPDTYIRGAKNSHFLVQNRCCYSGFFNTYLAVVAHMPSDFYDMVGKHIFYIIVTLLSILIIWMICTLVKEVFVRTVTRAKGDDKFGLECLKLWLCLLFSSFLLPTSKMNMPLKLFHYFELVEDFGCHNWAQLITDQLFRNMDSTSKSVRRREKIGDHAGEYIHGCVTVLNVFLWERTTLFPPSSPQNSIIFQRYEGSTKRRNRTISSLSNDDVSAIPRSVGRDSPPSEVFSNGYKNDSTNVDGIPSSTKTPDTLSQFKNSRIKLKAVNLGAAKRAIKWFTKWSAQYLWSDELEDNPKFNQCISGSQSQVGRRFVYAPWHHMFG